ncbi:MAG: glycosyltransferase family 2 protein [Candidatus Jacksonbacteria bacterium]|jgi:GT2 family glycosyltransferase|nr:glycosyltransferase family 2 protein [Candidatus Jacksonbacteria bacterium]MBT6300949.1 glycosyltransferase family 2 protein [Candidatus Jacksonbacteria bacterium]
MTSKIGIVILHYNNISATRWCIWSCLKNEYTNFNLVVVCNGTPEEDRESLQDLALDPRVSIVQSLENKGYAGGMNIGISKALEDSLVEYVFVLNNDSVLHPQALSLLIGAAQEKNVAMVAPRIVGLEYPHCLESIGLQLNKGWFPFLRKDRNEILMCPSGAAALYRRDMLERLYSIDGYYFDEDFFCYNEDLDLGWRARRAGFLASDCVLATVYHEWSGATSVGSGFVVYHSFRNLWWMWAKNIKKEDFINTLGWTFLTLLVIAVRYSFSVRFVDFWKGLIHGIKGIKKAKTRRKGEFSTDRKLFVSSVFLPKYVVKKDKKG